MISALLLCTTLVIPTPGGGHQSMNTQGGLTYSTPTPGGGQTITTLPAQGYPVFGSQPYPYSNTGRYPVSNTPEPYGEESSGQDEDGQ